MLSPQNTILRFQSTPSTSASPNLELARARHAAGLRILPVAPGWRRPSYYLPDGRVQPMEWKPYQHRPATEGEMSRWYAHPATAHAVLCGTASGGTDGDGHPLVLEVIDLDAPAIAADFLSRPYLQPILDRVLLERTHKDHAHAAYRVVAEGRALFPKQLAMRPYRRDGEAKVDTLVELLGEPIWYCVISPSPGYEIGHGDWCNVPIITHAERETLLRAAASYDERPMSRAPHPRQVVPSTTANPPGECCATEPEQGVTPPRSTPCSGGKGYGARAAAALRDPANVPALCRALGLPPNLQEGMAVHCPCDQHAHGDQSPSGVWRVPTATTKDFGVFCFKASKFFTMNEIFHFREGSALLALRAETDDNGTRHEHRRMFLLWGLRLLERAGILHIPHAWGAPTFPREVSEDSHLLYETAKDIARFRYATEHGSKAPVPLSYRFVRDWSVAIREWTHERLQAAFTTVLSRGYLIQAGTFGHGCMKVLLWVFSDRARRRARKYAPGERTIATAVAAVDATPVPVQDPQHACPDSAASHHDRRQCLTCIQQRLEENRAREGIRIDPLDPYRLGAIG